MDKQPSKETKNKSDESPQPEILKPQSESDPGGIKSVTMTQNPKLNLRPRHGIYRPSHKATFIGIAVVVVILLINAGIIVFLMNISGKNNSEVSIAGIKISPEVLDTLGVSRNPIGNTGNELIINPNAKFNGSVTMGGDISISGQLKLNNKITAVDASLTKLDAGDTTLDKLTVNGDGTFTSLNLRKDFAVVGTTRLQGPVSIDQLLTINNSANVMGNLSVGGVLSARTFQASSLTSDSTLTIGGHVVTRGNAPSVSKGIGLVGTDTVSISGNDVSGTVAVNIGAGSRSGIVADISFVNQYGNIPHVVITAVGPGASNVYINRNSTGFSIGVSSIASGGHAFDYIIMQ